MNKSCPDPPSARRSSWLSAMDLRISVFAAWFLLDLGGRLGCLGGGVVAAASLWNNLCPVRSFSGVVCSGFTKVSGRNAFRNPPASAAPSGGVQEMLFQVQSWRLVEGSSVLPLRGNWICGPIKMSAYHACI